MSKECCGPSTPSPADTPPSHAETAGKSQPEDRSGTHHTAEEAGDGPWWADRHLTVPIGAGFLLVTGYLLRWAGLTMAGDIALTVSLLAGASTFAPSAVRSLIRGRLGVSLLMTIAAIGAVALGRVGEAAALAFLFSIAEALEDRAMDRARDGLRALLSLIPETARLSTLKGERTIAASEVEEFDLLAIRPGERVATDGIVVEGRSSIDASAITGESIPVEVGPGSSVSAGSINGGGALLIEATSSGQDNSLTTIVRLVEQAHARKGNRARLADRIARPLVPSVLIASALVVVYGFFVGEPLLWLERALVVLVAASPCALAIAVPVTVISAIGAASRFGLVIKSGEAFEQLGTITHVVFDKTGTLTRNRPSVVQVVPSNGTTAGQVLDAAASLEAKSIHPLASAITAAQPDASGAGDVTEHTGLGITGNWRGKYVRLGSPRWVTPTELTDQCAALERDGMTVVVLEQAGHLMGLIGIRDEVKPEAQETVRALTSQGIRVSMLTGDNERTASAVATQAGISHFRAEQRPADKAAAIDSFAAMRRTAMIGDGINDAPALARADVGIAMGVTGSAAAIESADVAFTGTDLRLIPQALMHARRGRRIMTGNIILALAIIVVLVPLALFGLLGLAGVVLVHEIAEVVVILNGVRAARGRRTLTSPKEHLSTLTPQRA